MLNFIANLSIALDYIIYVISFLFLYATIYFFVVFLENRKKIIAFKNENSSFQERDYPSISITVPAYNEEFGIAGTVESLLSSDYPSHKLCLILVDDGSTDNTFQVMKKYENHPQVKIFTKINGGKHTAQNLGIENSQTDLVGSIDADCTVKKNTLRKMAEYFMKDKDLMGLSPSTIIKNPKGIVGIAQALEYELQIYMKKMYSLVGATNVISGTLPLFKREVFEKIGEYTSGHKTEDQEITLRMQLNKMKIDHASNAFVYTRAQKGALSLYKQRKRWIYGFIKNTLDYKILLFNRNYGNIGFITLPIGLIAIFFTIFTFLSLLLYLVKFIYIKALVFSALDYSMFSKAALSPKFDLFFIGTSSIVFIAILFYIFFLVSLYLSKKMYNEKTSFTFKSILSFVVVYSLLTPLWSIRAVLNSVKNSEPNWTKEINSRITN